MKHKLSKLKHRLLCKTGTHQWVVPKGMCGNESYELIGKRECVYCERKESAMFSPTQGTSWIHTNQRFNFEDFLVEPATGIETDLPQFIVWLCVPVIALAVAWIPAKEWIAWLMQ